MKQTSCAQAGSSRMTVQDIPDDILTFIRECIDSVEQLRVLLLLQADPAKTWSVGELSQELRSSDGSVSKRLEDLYVRQVLARATDRRGLHQFSPTSAKVAELTTKLSQLFEIKPYRVIEVIYSRPSDALKGFADAFIIRGKK